MHDKLQRTLPYIFLIIFSLAFTSPLFSKLTNTGIYDWDQHCVTDEVPRITILHYFQFPFWNPYSNGGRPMLANAQAIFLRPTFFLTLIFGCVVGIKLEVFVLTALSMIGMFLLSRYYKTDIIAGLFMSAIFGMSSFFTQHIAVGHVVLFYIYLLPYPVFFFLKSLDDKTYLIWSALALAIILLGGTSHSIVPVAFFLGAFSLFLSLQKLSIKPVFLAGIILLLACGFGAVKLIPTLELSKEHPRYILSTEKTTLKGMYEIFLNRNESFQPIGLKRFEEQGWGWHEFSAYTGIVPLMFFALGLVLFWRKEFALLLSSVLFFLLALGDFSRWSPWHLLHQQPIFNMMRVPSRWIIFVIFPLAVIAGLSADWLLKRKKYSLAIRHIVYVLIVVAVADLFIVNSAALWQAAPTKHPTIERNQDFHQIFDINPARSGASSSAYYNLLENNGTVNAYDPVPYKVFAKGVSDANYSGEVYLENGESAFYSYWSPNKLIVNSQATMPTRLIINQNYDKYWHVRDGAAKSFNGLLSTIVPAGEATVEFYYFPKTFVMGCVITLFSIIISVLFLRRKELLRRASFLVRNL